MLTQPSCDFDLAEGGFEPSVAGGGKHGAPATA
jgi:hypothetical protein